LLAVPYEYYISLSKNIFVGYYDTASMQVVVDFVLTDIGLESRNCHDRTAPQ